MSTALVIEGDRIVRCVLSLLLKTDGGTIVEVAENGEAGREALRHGCWDLVMCNIDLPDGDGLELVRDAKRGDPKLPVAVMIRADRLVPGTLACRDVDEFLAQPLDAEQIIAVSRRLIAGRTAANGQRPVPHALEPITGLALPGCTTERSANPT